MGKGWSQLPDLDFIPNSDTRRMPVFPLKDKNNLTEQFGLTRQYFSVLFQYFH